SLAATLRTNSRTAASFVEPRGMAAILSKYFQTRSGSKFASAGIMACSVVLRWGSVFDLESSPIVHPSRSFAAWRSDIRREPFRWFAIRTCERLEPRANVRCLLVPFQLFGPNDFPNI